jgi:DNA end-binding protein Ku
MRKTRRCALAKWAWKGKQYPVQVRPTDEGLVLQQLLYADEVRSFADLDIEKVSVGAAEVALATQLIDQISVDNYDPTAFQDEEKLRILAAIDKKIAGKKIIASAPAQAPAAGGQIIDIMDALRASLNKKAPAKAAKAAASDVPAVKLGERKPARRVSAVAETARARARK